MNVHLIGDHPHVIIIAPTSHRLGAKVRIAPSELAGETFLTRETRLRHARTDGAIVRDCQAFAPRSALP